MSLPRVDREKKTIHGYHVMSLGEARGHGMIVDETTLEQLVKLGNAQVNTKTRVWHPGAKGDGFGHFTGYSSLLRREGEHVVADLQISPLAEKSLAGNLAEYLMNAAELAPDTFGASPEVEFYKQPVPGSKLPAMRLKKLRAIAIVDDPATNSAFLSFLSALEQSDMSVELETKIADLTKERDTIAGELSSIKLQLVKLQADHKVATEGHAAALSAAKAEGIAAAVKAERERVADVLALCNQAKQGELAAKHIADGTSKADVQTVLFAALCNNNKPLGDDGKGGKTDGGDPHAKYKSEYAALSAQYAAAGISEEDYIASRRITEEHQGNVSQLPPAKK